MAKKKSVKQELLILSAEMDRVGMMLMKTGDMTQVMRGAGIIEAGETIANWRKTPRGRNHGLDSSIETTNETVREETTDQVEES